MQELTDSLCSDFFPAIDLKTTMLKTDLYSVSNWMLLGFEFCTHIHVINQSGVKTVSL